MKDIGDIFKESEKIRKEFDKKVSSGYWAWDVLKLDSVIYYKTIAYHYQALNRITEDSKLLNKPFNFQQVSDFF